MEYDLYFPCPFHFGQGIFFFAVIYKKVSWFCDGRDDSRRNLQNVGRRQI